MKSLHLRNTIPLLLFAAGCFVLAAGVKTDHSHTTDFSLYKTYSWLKVNAPDKATEDRIMHAVDTEFVSHGWVKVSTGGDASVAAFTASSEQPDIHAFYESFGGGWMWNEIDGDSSKVEKSKPGMLVVDIFDSQSKKLIWRSIADEALSEKKDLETDVDEMFDHFAPHPVKAGE